MPGACTGIKVYKGGEAGEGGKAGENACISRAFELVLAPLDSLQVYAFLQYMETEHDTQKEGGSNRG